MEATLGLTGEIVVGTERIQDACGCTCTVGDGL